MLINSIITNLGKEVMAKTFANMVSWIDTSVFPNVPHLNPLGAKYFRVGEGGFKNIVVPPYPPVTPPIPVPGVAYYKNPDTRSGELIGLGAPPQVVFSGTLDFFPVLYDVLTPGLVKITDNVEIFSDDGAGNLVGDLGGTGIINYTTGAYSVTFNTAPLLNAQIEAYYAWDRTTIFAEDDPLLYYFEKQFGADANTKIEYEYFEGVDTVLCTCYVDVNEAIDRGGGVSPHLYEIGIYDEQDNLIAYGNFAEHIKTFGTVMKLELRLLF